jgi:hypothetical protein
MTCVFSIQSGSSHGDSPICDIYERRLAELIDLFQSRERELVAA